MRSYGIATSAISERIYSDLQGAMRTGDAQRRDTLRMLRSALHNQEIELRRELSDEEVQDVVERQVKQRREAVEMFRQGGRVELADQEEAEIRILIDYLPAQLTAEELQEIVTAKVAELGLHGPRDMGKLMPELLTATAGRADRKLLSALAKEELQRQATVT